MCSSPYLVSSSLGEENVGFTKLKYYLRIQMDKTPHVFYGGNERHRSKQRQLVIPNHILRKGIYSKQNFTNLCEYLSTN